MLVGKVSDVQIETLGSELTTDSLTGALILEVESTSDFADGGGLLSFVSNQPNNSDVVITMAYDLVDDELSTIHLTQPLPEDVLTETRIDVYPPATRAVASVVTDTTENEEAVWAHIDASLRPQLEEGVRELDTAEAVLLEEYGESFRIIDILGTSTLISGESIEPGGITVPGGTDGQPPGSSPQPTIIGGPGYLYIRWIGTGNADPVTYEVHISETSGFTPDSTTLVNEVQGISVFIRTLADGSNLEYWVDPTAENLVQKVYYVRLWAKDVDGTAQTPGVEVPGSLQQITSDDIVVGTLLAELIVSGVLVGEQLQAGLAILNTLIFGDPDSQHGEADGAGIRLIDAAGNVLVELPTTDGADAVFKGGISAIGAEVEGLRVRGTNNTLEPSSSISASSTVSDPSTAPAVTSVWLKLALDRALTPSGLAWDPAGDVDGLTTTVWVSGGTTVHEFLTDGSGTRNRHYQETNPENNCLGVAVLGGFLFILRQRGAQGNIYELLKLDHSTLEVLSTADISARIHNTKPGLGQDGTNLVVVTNTAGPGGTTTRGPRLLRYSPSTLAFVNQTDLTGQTYTGDRRFHGYVFLNVDGADRHYLSTTASGGETGLIWVFLSSTGAYQSNRDFQGPDDRCPGLTHNGFQFVTGREGNAGLTLHSNWIWTTESDRYWVGYTWYDSAGTPHETLISPRKQLVHQRRSYMRITVPNVPSGGADDPDSFRVYMTRSDTTPANAGSPSRFPGLFQEAGSPGETTITLDTFDTAGSAPENPGTNDFPAGTPPILDMGGGAFFFPRATANPTGTQKGQAYYNTTANELRVYNGTTWVSQT